MDRYYQQDLVSEQHLGKEILHHRNAQNELKKIETVRNNNNDYNLKYGSPGLSNCKSVFSPWRMLKFFQKGWVGKRFSLWFRC
jgi:hypothetical protein